MSRRPFLVNVAALLHHPGSPLRERRAGAIPDLKVAGTSVPERGEVEVDVVLEAVQPGVLVSGTVTAPWAGECRRCLAPASGEAHVEVRELFGPQGDPELCYPLTGEQLDLEPMARDAVLLELPLVPLCRPNCQGLCPYCGADRNVEECGCQAVGRDPRWSALDALAPEEHDQRR